MAIVLGVSGVWLQAQLEARFEESLESKLEEHVRALREFGRLLRPPAHSLGDLVTRGLPNSLSAKRV